MCVYHIQPSSSLTGEIVIPGDKSISHRALILGAIAQGTTVIHHFLKSKDCIATLNALAQMGVQFTEKNNTVYVHGVGLNGLRQPNHPLDLGNSGTALRLLAGILAAQRFSCELTGDESLRKRPMDRIILPLSIMGATIRATAKKYAPLYLKGGQILRSIAYRIPIASAQVKSCLLLAALYAQGETTVIEGKITRDHTERMLKNFGIIVKKESQALMICGMQKLKATEIYVPSDISSAAFFIVGALIAEKGEILLRNIGINPSRVGILHILKSMGANIKIENITEKSGEPVADIRVYSSRLHGTTINPSEIVLAIDEFPAIFIAAACAYGKTILRGASELRVKESDRIHVMALGLSALGIAVEEYSDGLAITGGQIKGGRVHSHGDHRVAMAFSMASLRAQSEIVIEDCMNIATSFPNFATIAKDAGLRFKIHE